MKRHSHIQQISLFNQYTATSAFQLLTIGHLLNLPRKLLKTRMYAPFELKTVYTCLTLLDTVSWTFQSISLQEIGKYKIEAIDANYARDRRARKSNSS